MIHLPNPLAKSPSETSQLFFVIILAEQYASSALWGVVNGELQVIKHSDDHAWQDEETCINAVDQSLQQLGKESENVSQTLFALPSDWVDASGIVSEKKQLFQKMTKDLSLEPIGFVVSTEAITQYLTKTSPQLNIFMLEVGISALTIALVKAGQITQTIKVGRSGESVSDLREALAHLKEQSLPAKIELYSPSLSQEELNEVQQQLIGFNWKEAYPFLHPPVIEVFEAAPFVEVVVKTGGIALVIAKGLLPPGSDKLLGNEKTTAFTDTATEETNKSNLAPVSAAEMGFATSSLAAPATLVEATQANSSKTEILPAEPERAVEPSPFPSKPVKEKEKDLEKEIKESNDNLMIPSQPRASLRTFLKAHLVYILVGIGAGILVLALFFFIAAQSLVRAKVLLTLQNKNIAKDIKLTLDPQIAASDPDRLLLKASVINQTEQGEKTAPTTGTKIIGDKATGPVTIFNYTSSQKTFPAGTKLTSGSLTFTTNDAVTVASASSSLDSSNNMITKPGSQDGVATATVIGEDSNIAANNNLIIESYTKETYLAVSKSAFSGGSSREIQAVSTQDRDQLLASLKKELLDKATQDAKAVTTNGQYQVPTNKVKVLDATYNADVGKEANSLALKLNLQVEFLTYKSSDLQPLAQQLLSKELPTGYQLSASPPQILSVPATTASTSAQVALETNFSTTAEPEVNLDDFKQQIAGKTQEDALKLLQANAAVSAVQIELSPKLLSIVFHTLPKQVAKIEVIKKE